ncbi:MAG: response regulator transcription factor [Bryobacterales bacterium]|nr:response regulator transcription factor [Bryobacterales bacterium]
MKVLIVDDEAIARQILREHLEEMPGITIAGEAADGRSAIDAVARLQPDVVLLDLQMPEIGGFAVARALAAQPAPVIIYCTAFQEHALEGFETGAADYLLKPVRRERLAVALEKAARLLAGAPARKVSGRAGDETYLLDPDEIIAFQADGELVYILTAARRYYAEDSLRALEERMASSRFQRVHRKTLINTSHVRKVAPLSSKRMLLTMSNGMEVVVSKRLAGRFAI